MLDDRDHIRDVLESMKMAQATLQQVMTLSAGGLALFFGFLGKTPFVTALAICGPLVVSAWIASLSCAAYAHKYHSQLFLAAARITALAARVRTLDKLPDDVETELAINPNAPAVIARARERLANERQLADDEFREFKKSFFPTQAKTGFLVNVSLFMLVFGFVGLFVGYLASRCAA